ncbi:MAG: type ISP restriction/modification enzyme [Candidatus Hermodarchaeota archaeon]
MSLQSRLNVSKIALKFVTLTKRFENQLEITNEDIINNFLKLLPFSLSTKRVSSLIIQIIILRKFLFHTFGYLPTLPSGFTSIFQQLESDCVSVLNKLDTQVQKILGEFNLNSLKHINLEEWINFYEFYLSTLNQELQKQRGVFYTPSPVVRFILRAVDALLKQDGFSGLLDSRIKILDPSAGMMPFFLILLRDFGSDRSPQFLSQSVISNLLAFELLPTTYLFSYMFYNIFLESLGISIPSSTTIPFYLTNAIEFSLASRQQTLLNSKKVSDPAHQIKIENDITVILGNPPYSVSSKISTSHIEKLMETYKKEVKDEKNIQPLNDDYLKFLRFAEWKMQQRNTGIVSFITNNQYLNGLIHRGVRKSLLQTFKTIYILNLHGDSREDTLPKNVKQDQNVFRIRKGTAIGIFIRSATNENNPAIVYYFDFWGSRQEKLGFLDQHRLDEIPWQKLTPLKPLYMFVPMFFEDKDSYPFFPSLSDIFEHSDSGIKTSRDRFLVDFNIEKLTQRIQNFYADVAKGIPPEELAQIYGLSNTGDWSLEKTLKGPNAIFDATLVKPYQYRPFDQRFLYYERKYWVNRPRYHIMKHLEDQTKENLALLVGRAGRVTRQQEWDLVFVSQDLTDLNIFYRGGVTVFPLFLTNRTSNITSTVIDFLQKFYEVKISPLDLFYYIYAVLYAPYYRNRYTSWLNMGPPRIPFPKDSKFFFSICDKGKILVNTHLGKKTTVHNKAYHSLSTCKVEKVRYDSNSACLWINSEDYFPVPETVWKFHIGGYYVLKKWLRDRKNQILSKIETNHFVDIINALRITIDIQKELDQLLKKFLEFNNTLPFPKSKSTN